MIGILAMCEVKFVEVEERKSRIERRRDAETLSDYNLPDKFLFSTTLSLIETWNCLCFVQ